MARLLKIPVAVLGSWFHETHGVVEFSGDDLRAIESNFRGNSRGYEPYLKAGHNEKGPDIYDDEKAEAHMVDMIREGDVLYGMFEPHGDGVVNDIVDQKYRYASGNFIRSARDRQTGLAITGPILRGVSLTNTPCIPNMPRNSTVETDSLTQMLSDDLVYETVAIRMSPVDGATMSTTTVPEPVIAPEATAPGAVAVTVAEPTISAEDKTLGFMATIAKGFEALMEKMAPAAVADVKEVEKTAEELAAEVAAAAQDEIDAAKTAADEAAAAAETAAAEAQAAMDALSTEARNIALAAEVAALKEVAAVAEAAKVAAEAKTAELEAARAASDAAAAVAAAELQAAHEAEAAAEAARKEATYVQMLSDRVTASVAAGITPLEANRAKDLVLALRSSTQTVMLSDKDEPTDIVDAVWQLLSDRVGTIDFGQVGAVDPKAADASKVPSEPAAKGYSPGNRFARLTKVA